MNEHPATVENLRVLAERGVEVLPTGGRAGLRRRGFRPYGARPRPSASPCAAPSPTRRRAPWPARRSWSRRAARASASTRCASSATAPAADGPRRGRRSLPSWRARVTLVTTQPQCAACRTRGPRGERRTIWRRRWSRPAAMQTCWSWPRPSPTLARRRAKRARSSAPKRDPELAGARAHGRYPRRVRPSGLFPRGFRRRGRSQAERARAKKAAKQRRPSGVQRLLAEGVGIGSDENEITIITAADDLDAPRTSKARLRHGDRRRDRDGAWLVTMIDALEQLVSAAAAARREREPAPAHAGHRGRHARRGGAARRGPGGGAWPAWVTTWTANRPNRTSRGTAPKPPRCCAAWVCPRSRACRAAHNAATGVEASTTFDIALLASTSSAASSPRPPSSADKQLADVTPEVAAQALSRGRLRARRGPRGHRALRRARAGARRVPGYRARGHAGHSG